MNKEETLKKYLRILKEVDVHEPLKNIFVSKGYRAYVTHNPKEKGKDIVATNEKENLLITVKKGDIDTSKWNTDVHPTLTKLTRTDINHSQIKEDLPRRYILIFTGELKPMVANFIAEVNNKQTKLGEPIVEYWDINNVVSEFDNHLMNSQLFMNDDLVEILISIKTDRFDSKAIRQYIDNHCLDQKPVILNLITLFILRKSQEVHNIYGFFFFMEYLLVKFWSNSILDNQVKVTSSTQFDALNAVYTKEMDLWLKNSKGLIFEKFGLFDRNAKVWSEIIGYPLRTHNFLRRICYMLLVSEDDKRYLEILTALLKNNLHVLSMPIFEFHFNTIGLGIISLIRNNKLAEARDWFNNIVHNLILHFHDGYGILPLGKDVCKVGEYILKKNTTELCFIRFLLLEFSYILDDRESYEAIVKWMDSTLSNRIVKDLLLPLEKNESELYADEVLNFQEFRLEVSGNWEIDKKNYFTVLQKITRKYTTYKEKKSYILLLIDSMYHDRLLQDMWRVTCLSKMEGSTR